MEKVEKFIVACLLGGGRIEWRSDNQAGSESRN